jgi:hypothetical protein
VETGQDITGQKHSAKPAARDLLLQLADRLPLAERAAPLIKEFVWLFSSKRGADKHEIILPGYCYNIFEKLRKTVLGAFPGNDEVVYCPDPSKLANVKSWEEATRFIKIDWYQFGKLVGLTIRGMRFFEMELENDLERRGLLNLEGEDKEFVVKFLGQGWLGKIEDRMATLKSVIPNFPDTAAQQYWADIAYQFGPQAISEFNRGVADGVIRLIDETGELVGASTRFSNYGFLLILWPEMKGLLAKEPLPDTRSVFPSSSLPKANQGYPNLFKGFWKKRLFIFLFPSSKAFAVSKPFQGVQRCSKPFQAFFQKKKIVYFSWPGPPSLLCPITNQPKSTPQ